MLDKRLHHPDLALLLLRLVAGFAMLTHGWPKLQLILAGKWAAFPDPIGLGPVPSLLLATFAEVLCSLLLILGFQVRLAAVPLLITMLVAAIVVHANDPWARKELPLLYASIYAGPLLMGGGRYAVSRARA